MLRCKSNDIEWLEFELLSDIPKVKHAVYLRHGGFSGGPFSSLNTSFDVGDQQEHVLLNLQRIKDHLKKEIPGWNRLVYGRANHQKSIAFVNAQSEEEIPDVDGIITKTCGISLMMRHADCQIALFYDPKSHAVANIHAGWRGNVANIYATTIALMKQAFGSQAANLLVCISPSLGPDEAEFIHYQTELPEEFWRFQIRPNYFDLWSISEFQLQSAGVLPHHIEIARLSTYSNPFDFFSYRRDKITGRHGTCITLL